MMALISIEEHNKRAAERLNKIETYGSPMGVACPKCGNKLYKQACSINLSYPPQADVICPECKFTTSVFI